MKIAIDLADKHCHQIDFDLELIEKKLQPNNELILLDRGLINSTAFSSRLPFPRYSSNRVNAADSLLIQAVCEEKKVDLFVSLGNSTPLNIPMIRLINQSCIENYNQGKRRLRQEFVLSINYCEAAILSSQVDNTVFSTDFPEISDKIVADLSDALLNSVKSMTSERSIFYEQWKFLRTIQCRVDTIVWD